MSEWIPLEEEFPEEHKNYLITYKTRTGKMLVCEAYCEYSGETPKACYFSKKVNGEPVAWMPLPAPYKGEQ